MLNDQESVIMEMPTNFDALCEQLSLLQQLKEVLEIKPSHFATLKENWLIDKANQKQAIDGLNSEETQKVQTLCQSWWDLT